MTPLRRAGGAALALVALLILYLFFWPVPIEPVAWDAPADAGLVDPFEPNNRLRRARHVRHPVRDMIHKYLVRPRELSKIGHRHATHSLTGACASCSG